MVVFLKLVMLKNYFLRILQGVEREKIINSKNV